MYFVSYVSHLGSKIAVLKNMLNGLFVQTPQISQTSMVSCPHCQILDHSLRHVFILLTIYQLDRSNQLWPFRDLRMTHFPLLTHGGEITLNFLGLIDQMLGS